MKIRSAQLLLALVSVFPGSPFAALPLPNLPGVWELKEATISYTVDHPLKTATGTSRAARGKVRCSARACEALIAVEVNTFDSGDSNRDLHMIETTRGAAFPLITVRTEFALPPGNPSDLNANLQIEFAGQKVAIEGVQLRLSPAAEGGLEVSGRFALRLSDFKITPPSLLGMSVRNDVPVVIRSVWRK